MLIVGVCGGCRIDELVRMRTEDIQDLDSLIKIRVPNTKTKLPREFVITNGNINGLNMIEIVRKYASLRPKHIDHQRFFVGYRNGKCTIQPIGVNSFGDAPKKNCYVPGIVKSRTIYRSLFSENIRIIFSGCWSRLVNIKATWWMEVQ